MKQKKTKRAEEQLLMLLVCGATNEAAARGAGICERTVYRRKEDPDFDAKIKRLRADMVERTTAALTAGGTEAVRTLIDLMKPSMSPGTRLGAARTMLEMGDRFREKGDLAERIAAVEAQLRPGPRLANGTAN
jgi:hypothetical protein